MKALKKLLHAARFLEWIGGDGDCGHGGGIEGEGEETGEESTRPPNLDVRARGTHCTLLAESIATCAQSYSIAALLQPLRCNGQSEGG